MTPKPASFLGRAGPLVAARLFTALLSISVPLVLARSLSLEDYGTYKQIFLIATTLQLILPFGMAQSLYFFVPRADQKRVGSSRVDLQACKLEYSIVSPK